MNKVLVLIEGATDRGVVKTIMRKLRVSGSVRLMHGNRAEKLRGFTRADRRHDKFIVLKDLERYEEESILERFSALKASLPTNIKDKVKLVIARRAVEAWLLADPKAIKKAFGCRADVRVEMPEDVPDPAEKLDEALRKCGRRYVKGELMAARIAKELNIKKTIERSDSLKSFCESLLDNLD